MNTETELENIMATYGEAGNLPSREQWRQLLAMPREMPIMIVNLSSMEQGHIECPELGFSGTGAEAQLAYTKVTLPIVARMGIEPDYMGGLAMNIIGPDALQWDIIGLVKYPSVQSFIDLHMDPEYVAKALPLRRLFMKAHQMIVSQPMG